jgi:hypothetical protein
MLKRAEEVPLEHSPSWEDSLDDDLIFPFHSDSFSPRATLENRGIINLIIEVLLI